MGCANSKPTEVDATTVVNNAAAERSTSHLKGENDVEAFREVRAGTPDLASAARPLSLRRRRLLHRLLLGGASLVALGG